MKEIKKLIDTMAPEEALTLLAKTAKGLLNHLDERARADFIVAMMGEAGTDKVAGMVNL